MVVRVARFAGDAVGALPCEKGHRSSAVQSACTARVEPLSSLNHVTIYVVRNPDDIDG